MMKKENQLRNHAAVKKPAAPAQSCEMSEIKSMNLGDLIGWHCASCDRLITSVEHGWVEWLASEDAHGNAVVGGLRLVHRGASPARAPDKGCRYDPRKEFRNNKTIVEGMSLENLVGADGLMVLLSLLASGEFPKEEILEFAKRVHVPGYELTRNLLRRRMVSTVITPVLGKDYYLQSDIQEVIQASRCRGPRRWDRNWA